MINNRRLPFVMTGAVILLITLVTTALGQSSNQNGNVYTGCLKTTRNSGNLKHVAIGTAPSKPCKNNEVQISWNEQGAAGPQGNTGPVGPQGDAGSAGPQGDAGPAGVSGFEKLVFQYATGITNSGSLGPLDGYSCPAGKKVISILHRFLDNIDNNPPTFIAFVPVTLGLQDDDTALVRFKNVSDSMSNAVIEITLVCAVIN